MSAPLLLHLDDATRRHLDACAAARGLPVEQVIAEAVLALPAPALRFRLGAMVGTGLIEGDIVGPLFEAWEPILP